MFCIENKSATLNTHKRGIFISQDASNIDLGSVAIPTYLRDGEAKNHPNWKGNSSEPNLHVWVPAVHFPGCICSGSW